LDNCYRNRKLSQKPTYSQALNQTAMVDGVWG